MEVSPSGYYAWRKRLWRPPSQRQKLLKQLVGNCYFENRRRYGARRISKSLSRIGIKIGRRKVSVLLKEEGLKAIQPKKFKPRTTDSKGTKAAPNLLAEIKLEECAPTKIIIGDLTYIRLKGGKFCYLAVWRDKVTGRIIGWSLAMEMTRELVISALQKAIGKGLVTRRSNRPFGSRQPICLERLSSFVAAKLFATKYVGQRKLLATMLRRKVFSRGSRRS